MADRVSGQPGCSLVEVMGTREGEREQGSEGVREGGREGGGREGGGSV